MNRLIIIFLTLLLSNSAFSQQSVIKWSPFGVKEKKEALTIADRFMTAYVNSDSELMKKYIPTDEVNFGGEIWFSPQQFMQMVLQLRGRDQLEIGKMIAYTMDDTEKNPAIKKKVLKIYRLFSNLSIFVTVETKDKTKSIDKTVYLNMNLDENNNWVVTSFFYPSLRLVEKTSYPKDKFRIEKFDSLNFEILIPKYFSTGHRNENQITYIFPGNTKRDAAIQIGELKLKAPLNIESYRWVNYIVNQYKHSDILIKYMPYGYKFKYSVTDQNGNTDQGVTTTFEENDKLVYIQYFSFMKTYDKIWRDIDLMTRKLKIK